MAHTKNKQNTKSENDISEIKDKVRAELVKLSKMSDEEKTEKNKDIKEMIKYYISLTDRVEDRRIRIHQHNLQFLAFLLAGVALTMSLQTKIRCDIFITIIAIFVLHIAASLTILGLFELQSAYRYPFLRLKEFANKWKWFYYGSEQIQKINRNVLRIRKEPKNTTKPYLLGLLEFMENYRIEEIDKELQDNIQQLYQLQVHNYYKNRFYLQLLKPRRWSIFVTLLILLSWLGYLISGKS